MAPRGRTSTPLPRVCFAVFHRGQKIRTGGPVCRSCVCAQHGSWDPLWSTSVGVAAPVER